MKIDFDIIADYYDEMYIDDEVYEREATLIREIYHEYSRSTNKNLLDIGCGTGVPTKKLSEYFTVTGIDISGKMIKNAMDNVPEGKFHKKNMFDFILPERYGIAVNLFGSIGFAKNYQEMAAGLICACNCLDEGGILILTPWDTQETFSDLTITGSGNKDTLHYCYLEDLKKSDQNKVEVNMYHIIASNGQVEEYRHHQKISLFSEWEYRSAIEGAGFEICRRMSEEEFRMGAFICRKNNQNAMKRK